MESFKLKRYQHAIMILLAGSLTGCVAGTFLVWGEGYSWTESGVETYLGTLTCVASVTGLCAIVYRVAGAINSFVYWSLHVVVATVSITTITSYYLTRIGTEDPSLADAYFAIRAGSGFVISSVSIAVYSAILLAGAVRASIRGRHRPTPLSAHVS